MNVGKVTIHDIHKGVLSLTDVEGSQGINDGLFETAQIPIDVFLEIRQVHDRIAHELAGTVIRGLTRSLHLGGGGGGEGIGGAIKGCMRVIFTQMGCIAWYVS